MNLKDIYKIFPTEASAYRHLENVRWLNGPICPYCKSKANTFLAKEDRYRCNTCDVSYSVTVGTMFHRTRLDLRKWFLAIYLILNSSPKFSARQLGRDIEVTKDTSNLILKRIRATFSNESELLNSIINFKSKQNGKN